MEKLALPEGAKAPDAGQLHFGRKVSTDTFGWCLPQGDQIVVGVATAAKYGRRVWDMLGELKKRMGTQLDGSKGAGREAFCYPLQARPKLAHDRVLLVGDAAGLAAPTVRDGLYYACKSALMAAQTVIEHQNMPTPENLAGFQKAWTNAYGEVLAGYQRLEDAYLGADRQREILVDLAWDREAQRMVVDAFLGKRPVALPLGLTLRLATRKVSHRIKHRLMGPKRLENEQVARAMPRVENYLDLALKSPELTSTIPEAAPPVEHQ
jgi:geranylgeranyl reductase